MKFTGGNFWLKMAADQIVKSFLILVSVGCIVKYGSCAPIKEKFVLDNGTVLTMVINEVQKAPPPRYESALDDNRKDEDKQVIVIHEAQYAPPPRIMSKRSADHKDKDGQQLDVNIGEPQYPPAPRSESDTEEINTRSAVDVQTTKGVPEQDSNENKDNDKNETKKVSELPKLETQGNGDDQPGGDAENDADPEDEDGKRLERTTVNAIPTKSTDIVDGSDNSGSKGGSNAQGRTNVDAADEKVPGGNGVDDQSAKNDDGKNSDNTSTGESPNEKPPTEDSDTESQHSENIDNKPSGGDDDKSEIKKVSESPKSEIQGNGDDQPGGENIEKPSVSTPSDDSSDRELASDEDDDQEFDDKSSLNANDGGKVNNEEEEEEGDYDTDTEDDINNNRIAEEKPTLDDNEESDEEDDDEELDENYSKGRPGSSDEISESEGSDKLKKNISEPESSGHFMSYFLIAVVFVACFYLVFHNRQKIKAYVLEGKTGRGRRRKAGNGEYRQLSTAEEVLPATDKGLESKTTYTY